MSADDGLITIASQHSVKDTIDRMEASLKAKGFAGEARPVTRRAPSIVARMRVPRVHAFFRCQGTRGWS